MLSPKARRNLYRILPFGAIWFLFGQVFLLSDYAAVGDLSQIPDAAIRVDFGIYLFASAAVTTLGLVVGLIELVYLNNRFADKTLTQKIVYKTLFYSMLLLLVTLVTFPVAASMEMNTSILSAQVWDKLLDFLISKTHLTTVVQMSTSLAVSLFYAEISEHMGHGILVNFLTGKYHSPREEVRIFMFSDMKSSTTIAEQLGHIQYFELLRAYYADLSEAIVTFGGEIYQYVGDEVVVSWPVDEGLRKQNCIRCFHAMKKDLRSRATWYEEQYGLVPDFKSGLHLGAVTTGEIGALRREIIFTGDVLNATARIQGLCSRYGVDLLISDDLRDALGTDSTFALRSLGECELRGRAEALELFTFADDLHSRIS